MHIIYEKKILNLKFLVHNFLDYKSSFKSLTHQYIVTFGDISKQSNCFKASIRNNPTSRRKFEVDPENLEKIVQDHIQLLMEIIC